ncbi:hypothetical protein [Pontibacter roseus]|uniref:hypothetical protein n=1 Tax=Pontibacter roseus TaxID=336989 RepID=UPI00035DE6C0|nr:hypothetical protein [Pontibacter roseus]
MGKRRLFGDADLIEILLKQMELKETAAGGFASVYQDTTNGSFWLKYYATAATQGGGYLTLMRLPAPPTKELIELALTSVFEDEAVAAILRLLDEEAIEKKDFRQRLVERLEQAHEEATVEPERLVKVIKLAGLDDPMNRRELLHKSQGQIQQDADYYKRVADRAAKLLEKLLA